MNWLRAAADDSRAQLRTFGKQWSPLALVQCQNISSHIPVIVVTDVALGRESVLRVTIAMMPKLRAAGHVVLLPRRIEVS